MNCLHCTAPTTNGLALCDRCQIAASVILEYLPVYFRNLARWRPGRAGARPVPGSREPRDFSESRGGDRIGSLLNEVGGAVSTWARMLNDDRDIELPDQADEAATVADLCRLFAEHLTTIATLEWCGEFLAELSDQEARLRKVTEQSVPGWYAGECRQCATPTHVIPGLTWVTCGSCGTTTYARDHLDVVLVEARGWVARPMRMAEALVALIDTEISVPRLHKRISKWGERGRIETVRAADHMPKRFRLGDVLDRLLDEGATGVDGMLDAEAC